jgi:tetratricopeptide (TPR) repeat protein
VDALLAMARGNFLLHDPGKSAALLARADNVARATGEPEQLATVLVSLALLHQATGASAQALDAAREAGGLYQSLGKLDAEATVRLTEAQLLFTLQDKPAAVTAYQHSLSLFRSSGNRSGEAIALLGAGTASGMLHNAQGYAQAADYLAQAVPLLEANTDSG